MHNLTCNALFSIEVKYLENWNYKRDIENVYKRLAKIKHLLEKSGSQPLQIIQCLLITQQKWGSVKSQISKESKSQFCKFQELSQNQKPIILIWEDILNFPSVANNHVVTDYMSRQLNLNKQTSKYYAEHGHLVR